MFSLNDEFSPASGGRNQRKIFCVNDLIQFYEHKCSTAIAVMECLLAALQKDVQEGRLSRSSAFGAGLRHLSEYEHGENTSINAGDYHNIVTVLAKMREQGINEIELNGDQSFVFQIIELGRNTLNDPDIDGVAINTGVYLSCWQKYVNK